MNQAICSCSVTFTIDIFLKCQFLVLVLGFHKKLLEEIFQMCLMLFSKACGFVKGVNWRKFRVTFWEGGGACGPCMLLCRACRGNFGYGRIKYQLSTQHKLALLSKSSAFFSFCATKCNNKNPIFMTSALHVVKVNLAIHGLTSVHLGCIRWF